MHGPAGSGRAETIRYAPDAMASVGGQRMT